MEIKQNFSNIADVNQHYAAHLYHKEVNNLNLGSVEAAISDNSLTTTASEPVLTDRLLQASDNFEIQAESLPAPSNAAVDTVGASHQHGLSTSHGVTTDIGIGFLSPNSVEPVETFSENATLIGGTLPSVGSNIDFAAVAFAFSMSSSVLNTKTVDTNVESLSTGRFSREEADYLAMGKPLYSKTALKITTKNGKISKQDLDKLIISYGNCTSTFSSTLTSVHGGGNASRRVTTGSIYGRRDLNVTEYEHNHGLRLDRIERKRAVDELMSSKSLYVRLQKPLERVDFLFSSYDGAERSIDTNGIARVSEEKKLLMADARRGLPVRWRDYRAYSFKNAAFAYTIAAFNRITYINRWGRVERVAMVEVYPDGVPLLGTSPVENSEVGLIQSQVLTTRFLNIEARSIFMPHTDIDAEVYPGTYSTVGEFSIPERHIIMPTNVLGVLYNDTSNEAMYFTADLVKEVVDKAARNPDLVLNALTPKAIAKAFLPMTAQGRGLHARKDFNYLTDPRTDDVFPVSGEAWLTDFRDRTGTHFENLFGPVVWRP